MERGCPYACYTATSVFDQVSSTARNFRFLSRPCMHIHLRGGVPPGECLTRDKHVKLRIKEMRLVIFLQYYHHGPHLEVGKCIQRLVLLTSLP